MKPIFLNSGNRTVRALKRPTIWAEIGTIFGIMSAVTGGTLMVLIYYLADASHHPIRAVIILHGLVLSATGMYCAMQYTNRSERRGMRSKGWSNFETCPAVNDHEQNNDGCILAEVDGGIFTISLAEAARGLLIRPEASERYRYRSLFLPNPVRSPL